MKQGEFPWYCVIRCKVWGQTRVEDMRVISGGTNSAGGIR